MAGQKSACGPCLLLRQMNVELRGSTSLFAGDFAALWWWQENFQRITALSSGPRVARIREAQGVQTAASMSIRRREIESEPAPSIVFPGKTDFRRIVWEREK